MGVEALAQAKDGVTAGMTRRTAGFSQREAREGVARARVQETLHDCSPCLGARLPLESWGRRGKLCLPV